LYLKKRMSKKKPTIAKKIFIILLIAAGIYLMVKHFHIKGFCTIEPGVLYASGQPRGMDYTRLRYKYHIATIVNIRPITEHRDQNWYSEEIVASRNNGLNYIEMPIEKSNYFPNNQMQDGFLSIMADKKNLPVLLHGSGNDKRVAILVAVWLEKNKGYSVEETIKTVKKIIDDRPLTEQEKQFIEQIKK
jgi:protein tyrosine/serine phosphatase